jgi:hypothetical protein
MPRHEQCMLVSCEVPWEHKQGFLEDLFRKEIRHLLSLGFQRLYIFGTAGEGHAVDSARFEAVARTFFEETDGRWWMRRWVLLHFPQRNMWNGLPLPIAWAAACFRSHCRVGERSATAKRFVALLMFVKRIQTAAFCTTTYFEQGDCRGIVQTASGIHGRGSRYHRILYANTK